MGIKGIYGEIGPGVRTALLKLAIEKFEHTGRPFRIAIDASIWQFQIQAGQGGSDPATRTLYYRLLRLLSHSIQPLFVFDGPHKPPVKRNKRTGPGGGSVSNLLTKKLLKLFGFPYHMAPGEAEAECALLQREGIVDAVLSEDVDTLMFGSGLTLRNWSSEGPKGNKSPTHVNVYDAKETKAGKSGLDREGMILVALMSGGDYNTEGIPGCGVKVACEAARAGFGKSLCGIPRSDLAGFEEWRGRLAHELLTNESKQFRTKHKTLNIPKDFPDRETLGYYTHPVVSTAAKIQKLKDGVEWDGQVDVIGLRQFTAEAFDWTYKSGARKFIRGLAPALLVHKLRLRANRRDSEYGDIVLTTMNENEIARAICGQRQHFSTDAIPELRLVYVPIDIVGLSLDEEEDPTDDFGRDGLAPRNDDNEIEEYVSDDLAARCSSPAKRGPSTYDPTQPDKVWVSHTIAKVGLPLKVEDYEESLRDPKRFLKAKAAGKKTSTKGGMPRGAMDKFVKISKPTQNLMGPPSTAPSKLASVGNPDLSPAFLAPTLEKLPSSQILTRKGTRTGTNSLRSDPNSLLRGIPVPNSSTATLPTNAATNTKVKANRKDKLKQKPTANTNPWTISQSSSPCSGRPSPRITKASSNRTLPLEAKSFQVPQYILSSSPPAPLQTIAAIPSSPPQEVISPSTTYVSRKHNHSPSSSIQDEEDLDLLSTVRVTRGSRNDTHDHLDCLEKPSRLREHASSRPSPRKKISPDNNKGSIPSSQTEPFSVEPVAQVLDFVGIDRWRGSSPEFPEIRDMLPPPTPAKQTRHLGTQVIDLASSSPPVPISVKVPMKMGSAEDQVEVKKKKKYIMLRESLPGSWKEVEEDHDTDHGDDKKKGRGRGRGVVEKERMRWRRSQVEVVDMSGE